MRKSAAPPLFAILAVVCLLCCFYFGEYSQLGFARIHHVEGKYVSRAGAAIGFGIMGAGFALAAAWIKVMELRVEYLKK